MSIEAIKKRLEDANKTDWRIKSHIDAQGQMHINWQDLNEYNMRLIAHAPTDIAYLLEQNQRLVEALESFDRVLNFKEAYETWVDEDKLSRVTSGMEVSILTQQIEMTKALNAAKKKGLEALQAYKLLEKKEE